MDRTVATGDDPPLVLACMPGSFVERMGTGLRPGKLLRFFVEEPGIQVRRHVAQSQLTPRETQLMQTYSVPPRCGTSGITASFALCRSRMGDRWRQR